MPQVGLPIGATRQPKGPGARGGRGFKGRGGGVSGKVAQELGDKERTEDVVTGVNEDKLFQDMMLSESVLKGLRQAGFVQPSPVQLLAIPPAKVGFDLVVQSKSGTGKTAVFVVAALEMIKPAVTGLQALVLAPTREIAVQGLSVAMQVGSFLPDVKMGGFIGGVSLSEDKMKAKTCQLGVGTPGRLKQMITEGYLTTDSVRLVVLDEADKLLEPAFLEDTTAILNLLPRSKQVLALSATYPDQLAVLAERFMRSPKHVRPGQASQVLTGVRQFLLPVTFCPATSRQTNIKHTALLKILSSIPYSQVLVFSNYSTIAQSTTDFLNSRGFPAIFMSAGQDQTRRLAAIQTFKQCNCRILCSTDLTARGIDAENVNLVINLEVPWDHNTYLHRIGRGGRYGSLSIAITLASEGKEVNKLKIVVEKTGSVVRILPIGDLPSDLVKNMDSLEVLDKSEVKVSNESTEDVEITQKSDQIKKGNIKRRGKKGLSPEEEIIPINAKNLADISTSSLITEDEDKIIEDFLNRSNNSVEKKLTLKDIDDLVSKFENGEDLDYPQVKLVANDLEITKKIDDIVARRGKSRRDLFKLKLDKSRKAMEGRDIETILKCLELGKDINDQSTSVDIKEEKSESEELESSSSEESDTDSEDQNTSDQRTCPPLMDGGYSQQFNPIMGYPYPGNYNYGQYPGQLGNSVPGYQLQNQGFSMPQQFPGYPAQAPSPINLPSGQFSSMSPEERLIWYQNYCSAIHQQRLAVQSYYSSGYF